MKQLFNGLHFHLLCLCVMSMDMIIRVWFECRSDAHRFEYCGIFFFFSFFEPSSRSHSLPLHTQYIYIFFLLSVVNVQSSMAVSSRSSLVSTKRTFPSWAISGMHKIWILHDCRVCVYVWKRVWYVLCDEWRRVEKNTGCCRTHTYTLCGNVRREVERVR